VSRTMLVALTLAFLHAAPAAAQLLPAVGGTRGQVFRYVITAGDPIPTESGCSALVRILSPGLGTVAERTFHLLPGESGVLDVNLDRLAGSPARRVELLPAVSLIDGACAQAVEIYDTISGRTMAYTPGLLLPASDPVLLLPAAPLTPIGASLNQIVRLGAARGFDPQPEPPGCAGALGFADARGAAAGPSLTINLKPGEVAFIDLDPSLLLPAKIERLRSRRFVRPRLLLPAAGAGSATGCTLSVQLIDKATGRTELVYSKQ
jgi:hypothetical protein